MKTYLLVLGLLLFAVACQSPDNVNPTATQAIDYQAPTLKDGRLVFNDIESFYYLITMDHPNKLEWTQKWQELPKFTSLEKALSDSTKKISLTGSPLNLINRLMNEQGILEVQGSLYNFDAKSTKMLTNFKGTQTEITKLLKATVSVPSEGIDVRANESMSLKSSLPNARHSNFGMCQYGDTILLPAFSLDGNISAITSYIHGCISGLKLTIPNPHCPSCTPLTGYTVNASADNYFADDQGQNGYVDNSVANIMFYNWTTDRTTGSASGTTSINVYSSSTNFDIEGSITIGETYNVFGFPRTSQTTISF